MHPWEFERYTYAQFVHRYRGYEASRLEMIKAHEGIINWAAYCQIMPTLAEKYKKLPIHKVVPSRYEQVISKPKESDKARIARHLEASRKFELKKKKNAGQ